MTTLGDGAAGLVGGAAAGVGPDSAMDGSSGSSRPTSSSPYNKPAPDSRASSQSGARAASPVRFLVVGLAVIGDGEV